MAVTRQQLIGAWRLESATLMFDDGERRDEFGSHADGYLCYSPDGIVSATLGSLDRARSSASDPRDGTPDDFAEAARLFVAYAGPFTVADDGDSVTHHVDVALFPNWQGDDQVRRPRIDDDRLTIMASTRTGSDGRPFHSVLTWRRVRG